MVITTGFLTEVCSDLDLKGEGGGLRAFLSKTKLDKLVAGSALDWQAFVVIARQYSLERKTNETF